MNEIDDILISRYLADDLPTEEKIAFTERLRNDPQLAEELDRRRQENIFLEAEAGLPELEAHLARLNQQHFSQTITDNRQPATGKQRPEARIRKMPSRNWKTWAGVAGIAAAIALVLLLWNPFQNSADYRLYAEYQPIYLTEKSADSIASAPIAQEAFNSGNYDAAYTALEVYTSLRPEDTEALLAFGISALETDRDNKALSVFNDIAGGSSVFVDDAQFYLGLAALKRKDFATARDYFSKVGEENPDYGVRVKQLLSL